MSEFAGGLTQRVAIERRAATRDDLGGASGSWTMLAEVWAALAPTSPAPWGQGDRPAATPRWQAVMRVTDVAPGDRIVWGSLTLWVRAVEADPAAPDRLTLMLEEDR